MYGVHGADWLIAIIGAVTIGLSKTGLPGAGILAIPFFAAIIPARASTGVVLPMLIFGDVFAVSWYHRHAVWRHLIRIFPWTMTGVVIGYFLLGRVNDSQLKPIIGVVVLVLLAVSTWWNRRAGADQGIPANIGFAALLGILAGTTTMMANAAGPIMTIYLLAMRLPKTEFIGTGAWYFLLMNSFKVPFSAHLGLINLESLRFNLCLAPAVVVGALLGFAVARWIPQKPFNIAMQILAAAGAVRLLF